MRISIFGLGYVGSVTGVCLAELGHVVTAVEPNPEKVGRLNRAECPIVESGLGERLDKAVMEGRIKATGDWATAVGETDMAFICVGTPGLANGKIDLSFVHRVSEHIGAALAEKDSWFTVVVRSTVLPGTVEREVIPILEGASGKSAGRDFGVCMNPEFLREGSAVYDFYNPPKTIIGQLDWGSGEPLAELYSGMPGPLRRVPLRVAEMVKYADNAFHAAKVVFANEIGNICKELGIDSHQVMDLFCLDTKLNLSPYYLKPGFAFGGSCLPKDLRALNYEARLLDVETPMLNALLGSNKQQIQRVVDKLRDYKGRSIGFLGLSFKGGTDDLRESPLVEVVETILGKGFTVRIYDRYVSLARLTGANKAYIEKEIPHLAAILCGSPEELLEQCDVLVVGYKDPEILSLLDRASDGHAVLDLVRACENGRPPGGEYYGICW
jgi:GDP-mannose 6-dehydrogenase